MTNYLRICLTPVKLLLLIGIVFGISVGNGYGCSCSLQAPSPCEAFARAPVVFVGVVRSIDEQTATVQRFGRSETVRMSLTAHFLVERGLKGISDTEVDVETGGGGGDCGYDFKVGERYLVYASRKTEKKLESHLSNTEGKISTTAGTVLSTNICSRTSAASDAEDDLALIRSTLKGKKENRIFGTVKEHFNKPGENLRAHRDYQPMAGIVVKAEGRAGYHQTTTDANGRFRLINLKPGKYRVGPVIPNGYGTLVKFVGDFVDVEVTSGCFADEMDFDLRVDGRVSGTVYDEDGMPAGAGVHVSLQSYDADSEVFSRQMLTELTDKEGRYEFSGVPAGNFILGVNLHNIPARGSPYSRTLYPDGDSVSARNILTVSRGQRLIGLDLRLPPALCESFIEGIVVNQEGTPVSSARVLLHDLDRPNEVFRGMTCETDADGRFKIQVYSGRVYYVRAYLPTDFAAGTGSQSGSIKVNDPAEGLPIKLVLNRPGIFPDQK